MRGNGQGGWPLGGVAILTLDAAVERQGLHRSVVLLTIYIDSQFRTGFAEVAEREGEGDGSVELR